LRNNKKAYKTAPVPSPSSSPEGEENRTPELAGMLAITAFLRSKGGGGGLKSRKRPTYLVGAAAIVLFSGGGRMEVAEGGTAATWRAGATSVPGQARELHAAHQRVGANDQGGWCERTSERARRVTRWDKERCARLVESFRVRVRPDGMNASINIDSQILKLFSFAVASPICTCSVYAYLLCRPSSHTEFYS
jgi:hypothetical protein